MLVPGMNAPSEFPSKDMITIIIATTFLGFAKNGKTFLHYCFKLVQFRLTFARTKRACYKAINQNINKKNRHNLASFQSAYKALVWEIFQWQKIR